MATAPDAQGIPRYEETDAAPGGTFSGLLNLGLGWISSVLAPASGTLKRSADLANGVTAAGNAAAFQSIVAAANTSWTAGQPTRLYFTKAGRLIVRARATLGSTGTASIWLRRNGGTGSDTMKFTGTNVGGAVVLALTEAINVDAGDFIELMLQSNGTFTFFGGAELSADRVSPKTA